MMMVYCIIYIVDENYPDVNLKPFNAKGTFSNVGIALFVFEGNGLILNLRANALNKKKYPSILIYSILILIIFYMTFASVCYEAFRKDIPTYVIDDNRFGVNGL
jgi:amino acid transporter